MALRDFRCACGRDFTAITGSHVVEDLSCPDCGGTAATAIFCVSPFATPQGHDYAQDSPAARGMALRNKATIEADATRFLSGESTYNHPKGLPREYAPEVPSHLKKTYG